jgi:hypothetical protein
MKRRLPLGIQDFVSIREGGYCYADEYLGFTLITGVTSDPKGSAFSQVSVFSELNNLTDISFNPATATYAV